MIGYRAIFFFPLPFFMRGYIGGCCEGGSEISAMVFKKYILNNLKTEALFTFQDDVHCYS